jgi:hypothetical protein
MPETLVTHATRWRLHPSLSTFLLQERLLWALAEGVEMHKLVLPFHRKPKSRVCCTYLSFLPRSYELDCRDTAVLPGDSETVRCS